MAWDAFNMYWSCLYCGTPTYNMDSYCSEECREADNTPEKIASREEEKRKKSKQQKSRC